MRIIIKNYLLNEYIFFIYYELSKIIYIFKCVYIYKLMENSKNNNNEKEKKILMLKSMSYTELFELLKNKNEINSLYIWEKINSMINSNENKDTKKNLLNIINNKCDNSLHEKYFNYNNNNPYYNAFILKNVYSILDNNKIKKKDILEKLNIININNYYSYDDKYSNIIEILGKNYFLYYVIRIYKILISDNNEIINDEEYYKKRIKNMFDIFFYTIKELVKNEYLQNIYDKNNKINLDVFINSYKDIISEISNLVINDKNLTEFFIYLKIKEKTKFKFILFEGIILNRFSNVSEIISKFLIEIIENIKINKENKDNNNDDYLLKFYYYIMEEYFIKLVRKVKTTLQEIPENIDEMNNYQKNIINFFNVFENSLNYINILNKDLLENIIEYFDEEIISILYKINIKDFDLNYYEYFYGGLCNLLFKMIIQINSYKSVDKFKNIKLNLNYKNNPLVNFLFNEIMFHQFIQKKDSKTNKDTEIYRFKIKSKYTASHINNLFLLLIIKDFNCKIEKKNKDKIDENINNYLSILNSTHKLNLWSGNTKTSWKFNHKDKIKTNKFVGLKNLGNTCYMNSLFQILYNIELFRDSILKCNCKDPQNNSLYELKKLFFSLHYLDVQYYSPDTFPKNFEGNPLKINEQMDIDEFFATLMDKLESRLKENIIKYIFQGKQNDNLNFGESCPHKRTNVYNFYSIQLQIKDKKDIYESLDSIIQGETMEGDNAIFCDKCNKKFSALKNQDFNTLPRILIFVLKRFEFDYNKLTRYKINDYFEFPLELDMNKYTSDYINKKNTNMNNKYSLKGVVIHSGNCEMGHYYSIIKNLDDKNEDWYIYNDSIVTKFDINNLKKEAFGNEIIEHKDNNNNLVGNIKEERNKDNNDIKNKDINEERNKIEERNKDNNDIKNKDINEERNKNGKRNIDNNEERKKDNNDIRNNETFIDNDDENDISFDNSNDKLINITKKDNKNKNNNINNNKEKLEKVLIFYFMKKIQKKIVKNLIK